MSGEEFRLPPLGPGVVSSYVMPGEVQITSVPTRFVTILGSCVAICLYDPVSGVAGINHYLLPGLPKESEGSSQRWSDTATADLYEQLVVRGARPMRLQAKIFGGASILAQRVPGRFQIGERNIERAIALLEQRKISIGGKCVGGSAGRKIVFESHTGRVWVKQLVPSVREAVS